MKAPFISDIPLEILSEILGFLDAKALLLYSSVSRISVPVTRLIAY
jgi:hypothetical protein